MAVPFIIHNKRNESEENEEIIICQTEHCVGYICEQIGLRPDRIEDHYRAQMIVAHCNELFTNIYDLAGPLTATLGTDIDKNKVAEFINGRFKIWLNILEKPLTVSKDQLFYFANRISQADLAVFNILDGLNELFGDKAFKVMIGTSYPILFEHYHRIANRKHVKELVEKQKKENIPWFPKQLFHLKANWHV
eukprot:UN07458